MQFISSMLLSLSLIAGTQAQPADEDATVNFTFHGGPASYHLSVPVNNTIVATNNDISVNVIDVNLPPRYDAINLCTFNTPGQKTLTGSVTPEGLQQITVGPPQQVVSVSCRAQ